jgi:hypothetical protein
MKLNRIIWIFASLVIVVTTFLAACAPAAAPATAPVAEEPAEAPDPAPQ